MEELFEQDICSPDLGYRLIVYEEAFMNVSPHPFSFSTEII